MFAYIEGPFSFWQVLLLSFGFGLSTGLWYECLRIVRTAVKTVYTPHKRVGRVMMFLLDFWLDFAFFLILTVAAVLFLFVCNRGQLRLSILVAAGFGLYVYFCTLGRVIVRIHTVILRWMYRFLCFLYRYTIGYFLVLLRWIYRRTLGILVHRFCRWMAEMWTCVECYMAKRRLERILRVSEKGFVGYDDYISIG